MKNYIYKQQINNSGCFAEILYDISVNDQESGLDIECQNEEWKDICKAATLIFYDYFVRRQTGKLKITILEVKSYPAATNSLIVMYACLMAFCEGLNLPVDNLKFDMARELFCFPDPGSVNAVTPQLKLQNTY